MKTTREVLLKQFEAVRKSIDRAELMVETGMEHPNITDVVLYELIKSHKQIEQMVREIAPERFGNRHKTIVYTPELDMEQLDVCEICGDPDCESDHK